MTRVDPFEAASMLLRAGKSVCLVGPPGSGKTRLAARLAEARGLGLRLVVGHAGLTRGDLLGLPGGAVAESVVEAWAGYLCGRPPTWLLFDEVNRANVEVVLGELFTLLDLDYRPRFPLLRPSAALREAVLEAARRLCGGVGEAARRLAEYAAREGLPLPLSWRMLATMNLYDMAHLHRVGYALARRAPLLPVTGGEHRVEPGGEAPEEPPPARSVCREALRALYEELPRATRREPWSLLPRDAIAAYEAPAAPLNHEAIAERLERPSPLWGVLRRLAERMEGLGLLPGPAVYADACRLMAANLSIDPLVAADVLAASLLAPQLSYLAPRVRLEAALGRLETLRGIRRLVEAAEELLGPRSLTAWALRAYTVQLPLNA